MLGVPWLTGYAQWWEIVLIFSGLALLAFEIFVIPGHGMAAIPGAANLQQLEANIACSAKGPLPEDIQAEIESLGILHEDPRRYI